MPTEPNSQASLWQTFHLSDNPDAVQINAGAIKSARDQGYSDRKSRITWLPFIRRYL